MSAVPKLNDDEIADFRSRHPVSSSSIEKYGLIVKDQGRWIMVFRVANGLGYLNMPPTALPSFKDMAEGEQRFMSPTKGTAKETTITEIVAGAIEHPVFSTEILEKTVTVVSKAIGDVAEATGKGLSHATEGLGRGLINVKILGVPVLLWALLLAAGGLVVVAKVEP